MKRIVLPVVMACCLSSCSKLVLDLSRFKNQDKETEKLSQAAKGGIPLGFQDVMKLALNRNVERLLREQDILHREESISSRRFTKISDLAESIPSDPEPTRAFDKELHPEPSRTVVRFDVLAGQADATPNSDTPLTDSPTLVTDNR